MYGLNIFTHPLAKMLKFPTRIRDHTNIEYEERILQRPYIGDQLDYDLKCWTYERPIVIKAPTGAGKTWFVINKILPRAIKRSEYVLIISNRNPLNLSYKESIAKVTGKDTYYTDEGLQSASEFGNVFIVNYQGLASFLQTHKHINFSYVICDECHYFVQDATFSDCTGSVLDLIPRKFEFAVRIYISATIDEVLPYITRAELYDCHVDGDGQVYWKDTNLARTYEWDYPLPIVYRMDSDYSRVTLQFYEDIDYMVEYLKTLPSKFMVFCNSKKECAKIGDAVGDSLVINSEYLHEHPEVLKKLVEKEAFDEKCLATTSVFSNGNNIFSKSVRSVIITLLDQTELIQMAGRRRIYYSDPSDGFTLYIPIPSPGQIQQQLHLKRELDAEIKKCKQDSIYLMSVIKDGIGDYSKEIRSVFEVDWKSQKFKLNYLCEDKLYSEIKYLEYIYALISEAGKEAYCDMIARLFNKEFDVDMLFDTLENRAEELKVFIQGYGFPLTADEFEEFKSDFFHERVRLFGASKADNTGSNRKSPGIRAINNRLAESDIDMQIGCENGTYVLYDNSESEAAE